MLNLYILIIVILCLLDATAVEACVLCDELNSTMALAPIPQFEFIKTCGSLQSLMSTFLKEDSPECSDFQKMGSMCGCPSALKDEQEPACTLPCEIDETALAMPVFLDPEKVESLNLTSTLSLLTRFSPNCQMMQAYLSSISNDTEVCSALRNEILAGQCGCGGGGGAGDSSNVFGAQRENCQFCSNGGSVLAPDRDITGVASGVGLDFLFAAGDNQTASTNTNITCGMLEQTVSSASADSQFCTNELLPLIQGLCGCPWDDSRGRSCAEKIQCDMDTFTPNLRLDVVQKDFGYPFAPTCQEFYWILQGLHEDDFQCFISEQLAYICGCGMRPYLKADTESKQVWLAWLPRFTGFVSACASAWILYDIWKGVSNKFDEISTLYQLLLGLSFFDFVSSIAIGFTSLPIPKQIYFEQSGIAVPSGVYGAQGNEMTCTTQGFFVQLGFIGAGYNVALTFYYLMVIKYGMRENQVKRYKYWFHIPILIIGFTMAIVGIPYYESISSMCHIIPYAKAAAWGGRLAELDSSRSPLVWTFLTALPIALVVVVGGANMILIYLHVRKLDRTASQWRLDDRLARERASTEGSLHSENPPSRPLSIRRGLSPGALGTSYRRPNTNHNRVSDVVFWQAVFYMGSFLVCWPFYFSYNYPTTAADEWNTFGSNLFFVTVLPTQGFWNAIVYFRPRLAKFLRKRKQQQRQRRNDEEDAAARNTHVQMILAQQQKPTKKAEDATLKQKVPISGLSSV